MSKNEYMMPWRHIFDFESMLTPLSIERFKIGSRDYKMVYIFGVRIMSISVTPFH